MYYVHWQPKLIVAPYISYNQSTPLPCPSKGDYKDIILKTKSLLGNKYSHAIALIF